MCGIVGILTCETDCITYLLNGLKQLENRGYDSAGICCINNAKQFVIQKYASTNISALCKLEETKCLFENSHIGIGHTRWATHGGKTDLNSHPHISCDNLFSIVHNGIIENYLSLKNMLIIKGYFFKSETDSEVIANLLSYNYKNNSENIINVITKTINMLEGTWGLCILFANNPNILYCTKNGSPLLVGLNEHCVMAVSEQSAFDEKISKYIILNNHDICIIQKNDDKITMSTTHEYTFKNTQANCGNSNLDLDVFPHWTLKEIYEQQESVLRAISFGGRLKSNNSVKLGGLDTNKHILTEIDNLILLGCGTSYNAGMCGLHYFKELCKFNCVNLIDGADFNINDIPRNGKTALILLSQSGETKDLHRCLDIAKQYHIFTIGVINTVDSLIAREVDCGCYLNAGKEVAVASTKSFTSQCIVLSMVALWFSKIHNINQIYNSIDELRNSYISDLINLSNDVKLLLEDLEKSVEPVLPTLINAKSCFVLGKGMCESIAKEGSLKIKEISYIHSEGYSTSSLKHGPFALLDESFPVILIAPKDEHLSKNLNAYSEIKSRYAPIIVITNNDIKEFDNISNVLYIPYNKSFNNILSSIVLQMIAYKLSVSKGINPDMPKNLAKVVTVE
jgi:glucosamine--fructose-6-phosphate aminotransferase (isomerizing)